VQLQPQFAGPAFDICCVADTQSVTASSMCTHLCSKECFQVACWFRIQGARQTSPGCPLLPHNLFGVVHAALRCSGWDTPLSQVSPVFSPTTTLLSWVPQVLLHVVHVLHWHMLESTDDKFTESFLCVMGVAKCCLRCGDLPSAC
jgi:hypothetical protein